MNRTRFSQAIYVLLPKLFTAEDAEERGGKQPRSFSAYLSVLCGEATSVMKIICVEQSELEDQ